MEQERRLEMLTQYSLDIPSEHHKQQHYLHYQHHRQQQQQQPYQDLPQTRIYPEDDAALYGGGICHGVVVAATCDNHCCTSPRMTCGQGRDCVKNPGRWNTRESRMGNVSLSPIGQRMINDTIKQSCVLFMLLLIMLCIVEKIGFQVSWGNNICWNIR